MKLVIQVVKNAKVEVDNKLVNQINEGYLILVGLENNDDEAIVKKMASKVANLRINKDDNDKTNLSIIDIKGEILSISQFTLCADTSSRRPGFTNALKPELSKPLYELFNKELESLGIITKGGIFGAHMEVSLLNNGPFTILLDSNKN